MREPRSVTLLSASLFGVPQALALAPTLFFFFFVILVLAPSQLRSRSQKPSDEGASVPVNF